MTQTPSTQTNDTASAGRTVRRKSRPTPMKSWISAKNVFHTAMSGDTKFPMWVMKSPRTKGCPLALARMMCLDEAAAEHEGLELQGRIEDPEQAEDDLEHPLGLKTGGRARSRWPEVAGAAGVVALVLAALVAAVVAAAVAVAVAAVHGAAIRIVGNRQGGACAVHIHGSTNNATGQILALSVAPLSVRWD